MLGISRVSTIVVLLLCMVMAWALQNTNIALIVWIGNGGMMAAFAGPLVMGALWRGVTRKGAYAGLATGFFTFLILHVPSGLDMQLLDPGWFGQGFFHNVVAWLNAEGPNPFSCAAMGEFVSIAVTFVVSKLTQPLTEAHVSEHGRELRQLLSELEGSGVSPELRADLRRLHLLTRQIEDRPIDDAIDFLEEVRPYSAKGG